MALKIAKQNYIHAVRAFDEALLSKNPKAKFVAYANLNKTAFILSGLTGIDPDDMDALLEICME